MIASVDGRIAIGGRSGPLGGPADRALFHGLRARADAVMAGAETIRVERYGPLIRDPAVRAWRERMATPAAQALLRQRPGAAEWVNAQVSNRGLRRVLVRGLAKVRAVALWHALAINLLQGSALRAAAAAT